jgi:phasin family protein
LLEIIQKLNQLAATNVEKSPALQIVNLQAYISIGSDGLKMLVGVKTAEDLQTYVVNQVEVLKTVNERLMSGTRALIELNAEFNANVQKLAPESMAAALAH